MSHLIYFYVEFRYSECRYAECRYAECRYAECCCAEYHYAECRGALKICLLKFPLNFFQCSIWQSNLQPTNSGANAIKLFSSLLTLQPNKLDYFSIASLCS
jgi:hypothetical protein